MENIISEEQKKIIIFNDGASKIALGLLDKFKLRETADQTFEKIEKRTPQNISLLFDASIKLAQKEDEQSVSSFLENGLGVSKDIAENIKNDLKNQVVPLARFVSIKNIPKPISVISNKKPIPFEKFPTNESIAIKPTVLEEKPVKDLKKPLTIREKANLSPKNIETKKPTKKQDSYREPIQ